MSTLKTNQLSNLAADFVIDVKEVQPVPEAYTSLGAYGAGLVFNSYIETFTYASGEYRPLTTLALPYTTTGAGAGEISSFRNVGDALLRDDLAASGGAALVGYGATTVSAMLNDLQDSSDPSKGSALIGYKGRSLFAANSDRSSILDFIPVAEHAAIKDGTSTFNCSTHIQSAMDTTKEIYFPNGTYSFAQQVFFKGDGITLSGENMKLTRLVFTGTGPAIGNDLNTTVTRLFCGINNLLIASENNNGQQIVDWRSMQFGRIKNVWVFGPNNIGSICIRMDAIWSVTECTYNIVHGCYFNSMETGIAVGDGGNSNIFQANRFQPSFSGGSGVVFSGTVAGRVSNNTLIANGFEYPGAVTNGINVFQNCDGIVGTGNRFESMLNGVIVGATGNTNVRINRSNNYFESCTANVNISTGSLAAAFDIRAAASCAGSGSLTFNGAISNLNASRTSVGTYEFTFVVSMPDAGYVVSFSGLTAQMLLTSKTSTGFTVLTRDNAGAQVDSSLFDVTVSHNR